MAVPYSSLIPLFSNLEYNTLPSAHAERSAHENVDVLKSTFWLCANSFFDASFAALEIHDKAPHASDNDLFAAFERHAKITKEALNAIPAGALGVLDPEEEKVSEAMRLLKAGDEYVSSLREVRFAQEAALEEEKKEEERFHQNQMKLVAQYRDLKREMWMAEVDITSNALHDLLHNQDQYKDIVKRYHLDWAAYEKMFAFDQVRSRLVYLKNSMAAEYQEMVSPGHTDMREIQDLKKQADLNIDAIRDLLPQLRVKKQVLDNRKARFNANVMEVACLRLRQIDEEKAEGKSRLQLEGELLLRRVRELKEDFDRMYRFGGGLSE